MGRYDLLEVIGRGGAAVVYLARQRDLERNVALKELAPYHAADTSFAERFVEESRLAGSMNHANVVTVHEYFEDAKVPYIAMEHLPYGSLRQYIGSLSFAQIAGVLEGVLAGLSHGEAHAIVHRDLKPENLLVATDGRVKIADFGVARAFNKAATRAVVTVAGTTIGTPAYMSPEQALGTDLTAATDLYSLGVVAWELFSGQVPFEETDTPVAVLYRHVHETVPSVRSVAPEVDEEIAAWLGRMLAKAPEDRFQSADAAWVELEDLVLDLVGPRWRRDARLVVGTPAHRRGRTLTPAEFDGSEAVATPSQETPDPATEPQNPEQPIAVPVAETITGLEAQPPTVAPKRQPKRSHTTMLRIARRHQGSDGDAEETVPGTPRRRLIAGGIVLAMVLAAAGGVIVAGSGSGSHPKPVKHGESAAAIAAADAQLAAIMKSLALTRNRNFGQYQNAIGPAAQASDAKLLEGAYTDAAKQVAPYTSRSPKAKPLEQTLSAVAAAYGRVAGAARANRRGAYDGARNAVTAGEHQLQAEVEKL